MPNTKYRPDVAFIISPIEGGIDAVLIPVYRKWYQPWRPFLVGFREARVYIQARNTSGLAPSNETLQ